MVNLSSVVAKLQLVAQANVFARKQCGTALMYEDLEIKALYSQSSHILLLHIIRPISSFFIVLFNNYVSLS